MNDREFIVRRGTRLIMAIALCVTVLTMTRRAEATCSAELCREGAPRGKLLRNNRGIWTSPCGPNGETGVRDLICEDIARCPSAGGFGKFLQSVSGSCRKKSFNGYFGLDGLTFGILDWT